MTPEQQPGGVVYLPHFDRPFGHARHPTGPTTNLDARLRLDRRGAGGRLAQVVAQAGDRLDARAHLARQPDTRAPAQAPGRRVAPLPDLPRRARSLMTTATATDTLWALLADADRLAAIWQQTRSEPDRRAMRAAWQIGITQPGHRGLGERRARPGAAARCTPTVIDRDHYPERDHLEYRGACLGCGWVKDHSHRGRGAENTAVEDAHDHTHPGWRQLPVLAAPPRPDAPASHARAVAAWRATHEPLLPAGWLDAAGPVRTHRAAPANRHVPGAAPGGGYDLATDSAQQSGGQLGLF